MEGIVAQNLTHSYRLPEGNTFSVLHDVSFKLSSGECVALIGESGSGKSTIARLLLGFEKPSSGRIWLDGMEMTNCSTRKWRQCRARIQGVFQDASGTLNPHRSVYHNMEEGLINLTTMDSASRKKEILKLMELFHMDQRLLNTPTRQLSGGEQRRASLVRALALRPQYLILDEVTSGLDVISTDAVLSTLERYRKHFGCACLFITHDRTSAYRISDRILHIQKGRVAREGTKIYPSNVIHKNNKKENKQ